MSKLAATAIVAYLLGAVLTFGYAFNRLHDRYAAEPPLNQITPTERAVVSSVPAAALWPFYLSSVAFERKPLRIEQ